LRANALSVESEELHDAAALAELSNLSSHSHSDHLSQTATASSLPPSDEPWVAPSSKHTRKQTKATPPKAAALPPAKKNYTPFLASSISEDEEEDVAEVPAPASSKRTPDRGDFNVDDDKAITGYFKNNLKDSPITDIQKEQLVKKVVIIWSTAFPSYHKAKLGNNFTGNNKLGRLIVNAVKNDDSLLKGLLSNLDKHIANLDSNIKDLEAVIGDMIKTQQAQKETAAASRANKKAAAKANTTTPTASTTTDATTPANTQTPKPRTNFFEKYYNSHTSPSSTTTTTASSHNTGTASSSDTSTTSTASSSDSTTSTASSSTAGNEDSNSGDVNNSNSFGHNPVNHNITGNDGGSLATPSAAAESSMEVEGGDLTL
jgi:hypothetical protein